MDLPLQADVYCIDGHAGKTVGVILTPKNDQITAIVILQDGLFGGKVIVSLDYVGETTPNQVRLRLTRKELSEQAVFAETNVLEVPATYPFFSTSASYPVGSVYWDQKHTEDEPLEIAKTVPDGDITLEHGDAVEATDGQAGRIDDFLMDPKTSRISHLVMREGHLWGARDVTIPVAYIERLENHTVYLNLSKDQIAALPEDRR